MLKYLFFWRKHKVLRRGDAEIVINFNAITRQWREAGYYRDGRLLYTTRDEETLRGWIADG